MNIPKVGIYTGSGIRHKYFINVINSSLDLKFVIQHTKDTYRSDDLIIWNHFWRNKVAEKKYMGNYKYIPQMDYFESWDRSRNSIDKKYEAVKDKDIDYLLIFGCPILDEKWCNKFKIINLHLGKSPRYRGTATFFWTYYNKEEHHHLASTILIATPKVDAGSILKYILPDKVTKDYYKTTAKLIKKSIDEFPMTVLRYNDGYLKPKEQPKGCKYYCLNLDFNVHKLIDMLVNNEISCF